LLHGVLIKTSEQLWDSLISEKEDSFLDTKLHQLYKPLVNQKI